MSQYDFGTIDPYVMVGVELADALNQWRDAMYSLQRGNARPAFAVPGQIWINDSGGPTNWQLMWFVSVTVGDKPLFSLNTTTGAITVSASAGGQFAAAVLLAQAAASPSVQWNATGNPIDVKNWRMTVNGAGALVLSSYNDAGVVQNSITFNRDGSMTGTGSPRLYSESILVAPATQIIVTIPANARLIELYYGVQSSNVAVNDALLLQVMQAGVPYTGANHNTQALYGSGASAGAQYTSPLNGWTLGNAVNWQGVWRTANLQSAVGVWPAIYGTYTSFLAQVAAGTIQQGGTYGGPAPNTATGFRVASAAPTNFAVGSFLRCFAL